MQTKTHQYRILAATILWIVSALCLWAQKVKVDVQMSDTAVYGTWFVLPYAISNVEASAVNLNMATSPKYDAVHISNTQQNGLLIANYALRVKEFAKKITIPQLEVEERGRKYKSKTVKINIKPSQSPYLFEDNKIKAFVNAELSRPVASLSDTIAVRYKLYISAAVAFDTRLLEIHFPSANQFYYTFVNPPEEQRETKALGGIFGGAMFYVYDLGGYILQVKDQRNSILGAGFVQLDYLVDSDPVWRKILVSERQVKNERHQLVVPINELKIQVEQK